ncbi:MAG: hypothetical protein B1H40_00520 [Candidatus Latescibacteria bacterium 4484_181]|nr:MAG: hypothetical protein B1H40_00520 [Candidatus Latescibacteria bacterium 4484_181]
MRFKEIFVAGFGCLGQLRLPLEGQFNLILAPNDEGKTTLQNFITAVLFPFTQKELRQRFKPWTHQVYGGNLRYSMSNGEEFEIHKQIKEGTSKTDVVRLFLKPSNQEVTDRYPSSRQGPLIAETQLNMTRESFEGIPVIKQLQVAEIGDDRVRRGVTEKIKSLVATGREDMGLEKALAKIEARLKEIGKTDRGPGTEAGKAASRVQELERQYQSLKALHTELEEVLEEIRTLKQRVERLKYRGRELNYQVRKARLLDLKRRWNEAEALKASYEKRYQEQIPDAELVRFLEEKRNELLKYKKIDPQRLKQLQSKLAAVKENSIRANQTQKDIDELKKELKSYEAKAVAYPEIYSMFSVTDIRILRGLEQKLLHCQQILSQQEPQYQVRTAQRVQIKSRLGYTRLLFKISAASCLASLFSLFWLPLWVVGITALFAAVAALCKFRIKKAKESLRTLEQKIEECRAQFLVSTEKLISDFTLAESTLRKIPGLVQPELPQNLQNTSDFQEIKELVKLWADFYMEAEAKLLQYTASQDYDQLYEKLIAFQQVRERIEKLQDEVAKKQGRVEDLDQKTQILQEEVFQTLKEWCPEAEGDRSIKVAEGYIEQIKEKQGDYEALERDLKSLANLLEGKDPSAFLGEMGRNQKLVDELVDQEPRLAELEVEWTKLSLYERQYQRIERELQEQRDLLVRKETERNEKLRGKPELADVESDLEDARRKLERIHLYRDALLKAQELLREAGKRVYTDIAPKLNQFLTTKLSQLSGGRYSETSMDENLNLRVKIQGLGSYEDAEVLGGGMRAGLYILLRVGILNLIAEKGGELPPLIMDEAFSSFDDFGPNRLEKMVNLLCDVLRQNPNLQLIYFTCQEKGQYIPIKQILQSKFSDVSEKSVGNFRVAGASGLSH